MESLSFADDTFDKITTVESFYFWPAPQENLKEVRRVLKPGGTFVLVADTYNKEGLDPKTLENIYRFHLFTPTREEFQELFESRVRGHSDPYKRGHGLDLCGREKVIKMIERAELCVIFLCKFRFFDE